MMMMVASSYTALRLKIVQGVLLCVLDVHMSKELVERSNYREH